MLKTLKPFLISRFQYGLVQVMALSSKSALISYLNIAEKATTRDHYKRAIRSIREMWLNGHPTLNVAMKILRNTSPRHKK